MQKSYQAFVLIIFGLFFASCANLSFFGERNQSADSGSTKSKFSTRSMQLTKSEALKPGELVILQTATSHDVTHFNVLAPRYKNFQYEVTSSTGKEFKVEKLESIHYAPVFYKIDKLRVKNLQLGTTYRLKVKDQFRQHTTIVDERSFSTLDVKNNRAARFAMVSCLSDDWRFESVIDPMWERLAKQNPDFVILNGDVVYVDRFGFVERGLATEHDLWQRYIDAFQRIPYFHQETLIPTLATWDDHDYGTNDGDRNFTGKDVAKRVFHGFFGSTEIPEVYQIGPQGTYSVFSAFHQRFYLMDNRTYRQPNKNQTKPEVFAHWGESQHQWLISSLNSGEPTPSWIVNGSQFFSGGKLTYKESFEDNHPLHFKRLLDDLVKSKSPVVFASGDVHFSEVMRLSPKRGVGYETYEVTSSAMHSYATDPWSNPLRIPGSMTSEFNFLLIQSQANNKRLSVKVRSLGIDPKDYFQTNFEIKKDSGTTK